LVNPGKALLNTTGRSILFKKQGKPPEFEHRNTSRDNSQYVELRTGFRQCLASFMSQFTLFPGILVAFRCQD
jgi:hypothetical protein